MDLTIYSIGDAEWLFFIMQGVARIFDYGNSPLSILVGAAAALGLLSLVVSTWINPQSKPLESWFIGMTLFMILLGPLSKTNVTIESVRDGSVYTVDDVPAIASIAGFATSSLMYGLSTAYEDNWGNVEGFKAGQFLDPYRALLKFDKFGVQMAYAEQSGMNPAEFAIESSLQNYMEDCVMWDIEQGGNNAQIDKATILNSNISDLWAKLKVDTPTRGTVIAINGPAAYLTCPDAYLRIDTFFNSANFTNTVNDFMNREGITNEGILTATEKITAGSALLTARNLATARVTSDALAAAAQKSNDNLKLNQEIILIQSKAQRHYQMGADRELWLELAIGFATFLEGFVYFMMPIMAIVMVLGGQMMKAIVGFFAVSIWVSLWPVTMVAVNFFTDFALAGAFEGTATNTALSFGMFSNSKETIQSYLAVSSSLAAAVPMLSMYVLHRGVHTMLGVGGKAAPSTTIDSSMSSPDLASIKGGVVTEGNVKSASTTSSANDAEIMSNLNNGSQHSVRSVDKGTANSINPMISASQSSIDQNSRASSRAQTAKDELSQSRVKSAERVNSFLENHSDGFTRSDALNAGLSVNESATVLATQQQALDNGISTAEQMDLNRKAGVSLKASASKGGNSGIGGSLDASGEVRSASNKKHSTTKTAGTAEQSAQKSDFSALHSAQVSAIQTEMSSNQSSYGESRKRTAQQSQIQSEALTSSMLQQETESQMVQSLFNQSADNQEVVQSRSSNLTAAASLNKLAHSLTPEQAERVNEENGFRQKPGESSNDALSRSLQLKAAKALSQASIGYNDSYSPQAKENAAALAVSTDLVKGMNSTNRNLDEYDSVEALERGNAAESGAKKQIFEHLGKEYQAPSYSRIADDISAGGNNDTRRIERANPELEGFSKQEDTSFASLEKKGDKIPENDVRQLDRNAARDQVREQTANHQHHVTRQQEDDKQVAIDNSFDTNSEVLANTNKANAGLDLADRLFGGGAVSALAADNSISAIDQRLQGDSTYAGQGFQLMALGGGDIGKIIQSNPETLPFLHSANTPQAQAAYEDAKRGGYISPEVSQAIDAGSRAFEQYRSGNDETQGFKLNEQAALFAQSQNLNDRDTATAFSVAHGNDESKPWYQTGGIDDKSAAIYSGLALHGASNGVAIPNEHYKLSHDADAGNRVMMNLGNEKFHNANFEPGSSYSDRYAPTNYAKVFGDLSSQGTIMSSDDLEAAKSGLSVQDWANMNNYVSQTEALSPNRSAAETNFKNLAMASAGSNGGNGSWERYAAEQQEQALSIADVDGNTRLMIDNVIAGNGNFDDANPEQVQKVQEVIQSLSIAGVADRAQVLEDELAKSHKL